MSNHDYTAAQGARFVIGGLMILLACMLETICRTVEGLAVAVWRNKIEIALCLAAAAFCAVAPYVLAGIAYIMLG